MSTEIHTGGCQCGAIRFRVTGELKDASICHCRMCQKAFGAYYAPLVSTRGAVLEWTRGEPKRFQSSNVVRRGFCADCGTPLTYEAPDGVAVAAGAGIARCSRSPACSRPAHRSSRSRPITRKTWARNAHPARAAIFDPLGSGVGFRVRHVRLRPDSAHRQRPADAAISRMHR